MANESVITMAMHAFFIAAIIFAYMGIFGHQLPTKLNGPFFNSAAKETISDMLIHAIIIGVIVLIYMSVFGHQLPSLTPTGPIFE